MVTLAVFQCEFGTKLLKVFVLLAACTGWFSESSEFTGLEMSVCSPLGTSNRFQDGKSQIAILVLVISERGFSSASLTWVILLDLLSEAELLCKFFPVKVRPRDNC